MSASAIDEVGMPVSIRRVEVGLDNAEQRSRVQQCSQAGVQIELWYGQPRHGCAIALHMIMFMSK